MSEIKYKIFEVNENNNIDDQKKFAKEIGELEDIVSGKLQEEGKGYIFFTTGYDDICDYIKDKDVTIMVFQNDKERIIASSYITY